MNARPPPPPPYVPRPMAPEQRERLHLRHKAPLECIYCAEGREGGDALPEGFDRRHTPAYVTFHDGRGCMHLCFGHAQKRMTYSFSHGHSPDCPYHEERHR